MRNLLPEQLIRLADTLPAPLYLVGGSVRDFLAGFPLGKDTDWDIASPLSEETLISAAKECGFSVRAVYGATGTVKLEDNEKTGYEFTRFRSDTYVRGKHAPVGICFTEDIAVDARRRDFRANAVYFDIKQGAFSDPLGGLADIREKKLCTVREADKVFGEDGLRLMRLARISAETGFAPDGECLEAARRHAALIDDIFPERIFSELRLLLLSDTKHGDKTAVLRGLTLLKETGVLRRILPELALGDGMKQNELYHKYDVLEHSLRCCAYSAPEVRFAALLHDVGKPFCRLRDGNTYAHAEEGAKLAEQILVRLKAPSHLTEETVFLVAMHMRDYDLNMRKFKLRQTIAACGKRLPLLLKVKQADFSACRDDFSPAPCVLKWEREIAEMKAEGVPFSVRELAVNGKELQEAGVQPKETAHVLGALLDYCLEDGKRNKKEELLRHTRKLLGGE